VAAVGAFRFFFRFPPAAGIVDVVGVAAGSAAADLEEAASVDSVAVVVSAVVAAARAGEE
jgi:hypothetical protein